MKKLITSMDINEARKAGQGSIAVPPGALITPQARDDAKNYGVALVPALAATSEVKPLSFDHRPVFEPQASAPQPVREISYPNVGNKAQESVQSVARRMGSQAAQNAVGLDRGRTAPPATVQPGGAESLASLVQERVLAMLSGQPVPGPSPCPGLEETIAAVIAESGSGKSGSYNPVAGSSMVQPAAPALTVSPGQNSAASGLPGLSLIQGAVKTSGAAVAGEVQIEESLAPGPDGPGVTRMSWADTSFSWTFEYDEVLVVTEGQLEVAGSILGAGEAMRVSKGSTLTLAAKGRVSCVCSSWPKPE